jgi:hypothetical protein
MKAKTLTDIPDIRQTPEQVAKTMAHELFQRAYRHVIQRGFTLPRAAIERELDRIAQGSYYGGPLTRMVRQESEFKAALFLGQ